MPDLFDAVDPIGYWDIHMEVEYSDECLFQVTSQVCVHLACSAMLS